MLKPRFQDWNRGAVPCLWPRGTHSRILCRSNHLPGYEPSRSSERSARYCPKGAGFSSVARAEPDGAVPSTSAETGRPHLGGDLLRHRPGARGRVRACCRWTPRAVTSRARRREPRRRRARVRGPTRAPPAGNPDRVDRARREAADWAMPSRAIVRCQAVSMPGSSARWIASRGQARCRCPGPDRRGRRILASAGPRRAAWPPDRADARDARRLRAVRRREVIPRPSALFRASGVSLAAVNPAIGFVYVVTALDDSYPAQLTALVRTPVRSCSGATCSPARCRRASAARCLREGDLELPIDGTLDLADEPHAVRRLSRGPISFYAVDSLGVSTHRATRNAIQILSTWRSAPWRSVRWPASGSRATLARPIDQLSQQLRQIAVRARLLVDGRAHGVEPELDAFTDTFNQMVEVAAGGRSADRARLCRRHQGAGRRARRARYLHRRPLRARQPAVGR